MEHAIILAGGSGTRLWPMSRRHRPKQLLPLVEGRSLLESALDRLAGMFPPQRTWVITSAELAPAIRAVATNLPAENILGEPSARDTSNAIALGCLLLDRLDPLAKVGIFTADHVIRPTDRFRAVVRNAFDLLDELPDALVTLGVQPTWAHTGLGYIHRGREVSGVGGRGSASNQQPAAGPARTPTPETRAPSFHAVQRFVEKPDQATAERYLASGEYYWNSGMFLWRAATAIEALERFRPEHMAVLRRVADAWAGGDMATVAKLYGQLPKISIDYALMEPASVCPDCRVVVGELDCQWLDLGSWSVLAEVNPADAAGNVAIGSAVTVDCAGNILVNDDPDHVLAAMGLADMVVVHSGGATLVAPKAKAADIKKLLEQVRARFGERYE